MKVKMVPADEAAYILRNKLGAIRAWDDTLADMKRGRSTDHGLVLTPYLCGHDGKGSRPYYSLVDIADFISDALTIAPSSLAMILLQVREFEIDPADRRCWKVRMLP
ncbi:hypothetical protein ACI2KE_06900 [Pseudomonas monteilii]